MECNKADALHVQFRDNSHPQESPEDYVIRKMEALTISSDWTDSELIAEIMNSAPDHWSLYIDISAVNTWDEFLDKIAWHEETLLQSNEYASSDLQQQLDEMKVMLCNMEVNEDSDLETDRSHQEVDEDLSNDAYTKDNEPETDDEPPEQGSYRPLRSFAASVCAYTPNGSEVMQHDLEGDIVNQNLDLSCETEQPTTEPWNLSIEQGFHTWIGGNNTQEQPIPWSLETKQGIAADFGPETILNDKLTLEEPEPPPYDELFKDGAPRERLRDRLATIQEGGGGGDDPPDNGDSYDHSSDVQQ
ncbi:hypothetical protein RSAG8_08937, partial [Rhizoctonia solani AG-8 WAC10335]